MERIKALDCWQKGFLLLTAAMVLVFSLAYSATISREGFAYKDAILVPSQENGNTVYSGKIKGKQACFTVYADKTVEFRHGDKTYGPYTAKEDPTAISKEREAEFDGGEPMIGVEIRRGEEIFFRGCVKKQGDKRWIFNENGDTEAVGTIDFSTLFGDDSMEPSVSAILNLMAGPKLEHKGNWDIWFCGVFLCIFTAVSILFVDELFRWDLSFRIRNAEQAVPSEWEITSRYLGWGFMVIMAAATFIAGLW